MITVDGTPWTESFDMVWDPVFSPDSQNVAVKAEKNGAYFLVLNGKRGKHDYEALWNPVFSPDGKSILIRYVRGGKYYRKVSPLNDI